MVAVSAVARYVERATPRLAGAPELDALGLPVAARVLSSAVHAANAEVLAASRAGGKAGGMATTLLAALFDLDHRAIHLAHVGSNRCYRLRAGLLDRLTEDHTVARDILETRPEIGNISLSHLPGRVATRALGVSSELHVAVRTLEIADGDRFLLCSDGLHQAVGRAELAELLDLEGACEERIRALVDRALDAATTDNVAAIVVDCEGLEEATRRDSFTMVSAGTPNPPRVTPAARAKHESMAEILMMDPCGEVPSSGGPQVVPPEANTPELALELEELASSSRRGPGFLPDD
jgi:protein phosphatase